MGARRFVEVGDFRKLRIPSDPRVSPGGDELLFVVQTMADDGKKTVKSIWRSRLDGSEQEPFTRGEDSDHSPRWSPDGRKIAFISDRGGQGALYVMPRHGGEARPLGTFEGAVSDPSWSPDGRRIVVVMKPPKVEEDDDEAPPDDEAWKIPGLRWLTRLSYRVDGKGMKEDGASQLHLVDVATGENQALTQEDFDSKSPVWSPDGRRIAYLSNRRPDGDWEIWNEDVWIVDLEGGRHWRVESKPFGESTRPAWSPSGKRLLLVTTPKAGDRFVFDDAHPWLVSVDGDEAWDLYEGPGPHAKNAMVTDSRDLAGGDHPRWSADGEHVWFCGSERGSVHVCRCPIEGGTAEALLPEEAETCAFDFTADESAVVAVRSTGTRPYEIWIARRKGSTWEGWEPLTHLNDEWLEGLELARPEAFTLQREGHELQGWLMRPPGLAEGERAPLLLEIHGGPLMQFGNCWFHEFQMLAASGYGVLYTNPRGSRGYGPSHAAAIYRDWGEPAYEDLMAAVDWACEADWVDEERLGVLGGSYGGYMTNWVITHTDRFAAACTQRCVANLSSEYGTGDFGFFLAWHFGATPQEDPELYRRNSPIYLADRVKTPTLVVHSELDAATPIGEGEQFFTALRIAGVDCAFLRIRDEGHGLCREGSPRKRLARLAAIREWFDRKLGVIREGE